MTISGTSGLAYPDNTAQSTAGLTINAQSGNYSLALADTGKFIYSTNVGAQTITVPTNAGTALPIGSTVTIVNNGTTAITISTTGITMYLAGAGTTGNRTLAIKGVATTIKVATDTWFISGSGLS
jgi:hypothetical protein